MPQLGMDCVFRYDQTGVYNRGRHREGARQPVSKFDPL